MHKAADRSGRDPERENVSLASRIFNFKKHIYTRCNENYARHIRVKKSFCDVCNQNFDVVRRERIDKYYRSILRSVLFAGRVIGICCFRGHLCEIIPAQMQHHRIPVTRGSIRITHYSVHGGGNGVAMRRSLLKLMRTTRDTPPFIPVESFLTALHLTETNYTCAHVSHIYTRYPARSHTYARK